MVQQLTQSYAVAMRGSQREIEFEQLDHLRLAFQATRDVSRFSSVGQRCLCSGSGYCALAVEGYRSFAYLEGRKMHYCWRCRTCHVANSRLITLIISLRGCFTHVSLQGQGAFQSIEDAEALSTFFFFHHDLQIHPPRNHSGSV